MLSCHDVREQLIPFVLDDREEEVATQINDHLAGCGACREQERLLLALIEGVRGDGEGAEPGEALRSRIRGAVATRNRAESAARGALSRAAELVRRPVPAYLLAAACLAGVVVAHRLLPEPPEARLEAPVGRIVTTGLSVDFVVASPCETALDVRQSAGAAPAPSGGSERVRPSGADSL